MKTDLTLILALTIGNSLRTPNLPLLIGERMRARIAVVVLMLLAFSASVSAGPISFTFGYDEATIVVGGQTYASVPLTVQITGDTADVGPFALDVLFMPFAAGAGTLTIGGLGTGVFSGSGWVFVYDNIVGFGTDAENDLAYIVSGAVIGYDLASNLGPIQGLAGLPYLEQWTNVATSLGATTLTSFSGPATFTAAASGVPEPASVLLMAPCLFALFRLRRRN